MARPNVILILIDDMGWMDLACQGSEFYETPNIDQLVASGMRFTDAYASCPVCSPTRASLMTGKYPARLGLTNYIGGNHPSRGKLVDVPYIDHLPKGETTLAHALGDAGYATWHVGKWHLGGEARDSMPENHGFDVNVGGCHKGSPAGGGYFSPWSIPNLAHADVPEGTYLTDHLTDRAIDLIAGRDADRPFFLNMWYYSVHTPIEAKAETIAKYEEKAKRVGLDTVKTFDVDGPFPCEHKRDKRITRRLVQSDPVYAAMIEHLDENIGRLLAALAEAGAAEDTVILFTSDNGGLATAEGSPTCNAPLAEGKGWMYEGGTREPMAVAWPGRIEAGSVASAPVTSTDFFPTILELCRLEPRPEQHVDGVSLAGLLTGRETTLQRDAIFWHYPHYGNQGGTPGSSVRAGDEKLIEFYEDGRVELYDLRSDISEDHDLADKRPERARVLQQKLASWRKSVEADIPRMNPEWKA